MNERVTQQGLPHISKESYDNLPSTM